MKSVNGHPGMGSETLMIIYKLKFFNLYSYGQSFSIDNISREWGKCWQEVGVIFWGIGTEEVNGD